MTEDRYQICGESGLLETSPKKLAAFDIAAAYARDNSKIVVFDCMAKRGQPELWVVDGIGNARVRNRKGD